SQGPQRSGLWAQPWALLLLLLGPQLLVTQDWDSQEEANDDDQRASKNYFLATVEYGLHVFNLRSQDSNAYKVVRILRSWKEPADFGIVFSTELQLGQTRCGKFDEDIDNCPFQARPDVNNVRHATAALRLHGRGRCLGAGAVGSDDNAIPRDTEGAFAGRSPARQASPGSLVRPWPVCSLAPF
uniref:Cystatin domain-containing protein n=1 Tax=Balaenoptera musculus TaxID=9771 RepID=A0A8C0I0C2_BALMU